jgi:hypothetical protein
MNLSTGLRFQGTPAAFQQGNRVLNGRYQNIVDALPEALAVVDVGSKQLKASVFTPGKLSYTEYTHTIGLGEALSHLPQGELPYTLALAKVSDLLQSLRERLSLLGVKHFKIIATEGLRGNAASPDVQALVSGHNVSIISPEEEGKLTFEAVTMGLSAQRKAKAVSLEIGGGSLQLTYLNSLGEHEVLYFKAFGLKKLARLVKSFKPYSIGHLKRLGREFKQALSERHSEALLRALRSKDTFIVNARPEWMRLWGVEKNRRYPVRLWQNQPTSTFLTAIERLGGPRKVTEGTPVIITLLKELMPGGAQALLFGENAGLRTATLLEIVRQGFKS